MGIIIQNLDFPHDCQACFFEHFNWCDLIHERVAEKGISDFCPLQDLNSDDWAIKGYKVSFLLLIAAVADSKDITPAEAIEIVRDANRLISLFIEEQNKRIEESLKSCISYIDFAGTFKGLLKKDEEKETDRGGEQ